MAKIKNMGTGTMKFGEGIITSGSAGKDSSNNEYSLISSGAIRSEEDIVLKENKRFYFDGARVANGPYLSGNTVALTIEGDDRILMVVDKDLRLSGQTANSHSNSILRILDASASSTYHEQLDVMSWFSGSAGTIDTTSRGVACFEGDLVLSGTLMGKNSSSGMGTLDLYVGGQNNTYIKGDTVQINGDNNNIGNPGDDVFLFISGSIGGKGIDGTTVFGGDIVASGSLVVENKVTSPSQPAFLARKPLNNQDNFAINTGVDVTLSTEDFDVGSNFASNTFTAPTTGVYIFTANVYLTDLDVDATSYSLDLVTTPGTYRLAIVDPSVYSADVGEYTLNGSIPLLLTAGDTAKIQVYQSGGAQQTSIRGSGTRGTFFAGYLLG